MDTSRDREAITRAERQTDIHIDFELEDIIAGNLPASDVGKRILSIVEDPQGLPTQGKIEAALTPLYETMTADFYRQEGGTGESPGANRQSVKELAAKVIQARKVKRTAMITRSGCSRSRTRQAGSAGHRLSARVDRMPDRPAPPRFHLQVVTSSARPTLVLT